MSQNSEVGAMQGEGIDHKFGHHINVIPAKAGIQKGAIGFLPSRE